MADHPLIAVAREALLALPHRLAPAPLPSPWDAPRGVFVTLRQAGKLRGCIGHLAPTEATLAQEVAACAVRAATEDPRFPPVEPYEVDELDLEVSVLAPPEPTTLEGLDPRRYGVIVTSGHRRAVLLPDLDGVDTVAEQLRICRAKGGIPADAPLTLQRFTVDKIT